MRLFVELEKNLSLFQKRDPFSQRAASAKIRASFVARRGKNALRLQRFQHPRMGEYR